MADAAAADMALARTDAVDILDHTSVDSRIAEHHQLAAVAHTGLAQLVGSRLVEAEDHP